MDTKFTIKNFRVFDENGVALDLKPLTILTGCNSSGKSSIARSTLLLNSFLVQIKKSMDNRDSVDFNNYKIDFTTYPNNLFGTFDNVVPEGSSLRQITIGYWLQQPHTNKANVSSQNGDLFSFQILMINNN